jgi:RND family efflux transporter MFP subunit
MQRLSTRTQLMIVAVLVGAAGVLWVGHDHVSKVFAAITRSDDNGKLGNARGERKVPVVVEAVGRKADDAVIEAIATARAKRFVTLYSEAAGEVIELNVRAGTRVEVGDMILKLDSRATELAVSLAKVRVSEAETMLDRMQQLLRRNVNPEAKVDDARNVLERTRLELKQAEDAFSKRTLIAPLKGIVGIPKVEVGDRINPTTAVITLDDRSELVVEIEVAEEFLPHLAVGQKVMARAASFPERQFTGEVEHIDTRVDPLSRTVKVRAKLPNGDDLLRPGMSFAVQLVIPGESYPMVPELALQWSKGESFVWKIKDGVAQKVVVRAVKRENSVILVKGDIKDGDMVVVEGVQRLRPGRAVSFSRSDAKPGG